MIKICKIKKIAQPRTIEVTRLNGQAGTMLVIGLVLSMGGQELFAEILGEQAEAFAKEFIGAETVLSVSLSFKCREWTNKDGEQSYGTSVRIDGYTVIEKVEGAF